MIRVQYHIGKDGLIVTDGIRTVKTMDDAVMELKKIMRHFVLFRQASPYHPANILSMELEFVRDESFHEAG